MSAITSSLVSPTNNLRPFDIRRDLQAVADLVEACFADTLDVDGKRYVQQMHDAARNPAYLRWAAAVGERVSMPFSGFVWEEDGRLIGNLSLIPFSSRGKQCFLIANVAVETRYRRQGIARSLTLAAMEHVQKRGASAAWLHVRQENISALNLYLSLGFKERARRTTWESNARPPQALPEGAGRLPNGMKLIKRQSLHWPQHRAWLERLYPPEVTWHLPFNLNALRPGLLGAAYRLLTATQVQQWCLTNERDLLGIVSWQPHVNHADHLWLASAVGSEDQAIPILLNQARRHVAVQRRMLLDYPAGRGAQAIQEAGFRVQQTLIWMETKFERVY